MRDTRTSLHYSLLFSFQIIGDQYVEYILKNLLNYKLNDGDANSHEKGAHDHTGIVRKGVESLSMPGHQLQQTLDSESSISLTSNKPNELQAESDSLEECLE